jgi:hypothetical protein
MCILKFLILAIIPLYLTSCGIIVGTVMTSGGGVDRIEIISGEVANFKTGGNLLVLAPFLTGEDGYYISRGDDAANLAKAMNSAKLFNAKILFDSDYNNLESATKEYKAMSAAKLQESAGLDTPPEYLLVGTILSRDTIVAPMRGVMMDVSYRFELIDLTTREVLVFEVEANDLFPKVASGIVDELAGFLQSN